MKQDILDTYKELKAMKASFETVKEPLEKRALANLSMHVRINYKGYVSMKAKHFGTESGLGMMEVYRRMYCAIVCWQLFTRSYVNMNEKISVS